MRVLPRADPGTRIRLPVVSASVALGRLPGVSASGHGAHRRLAAVEPGNRHIGGDRMSALLYAAPPAAAVEPCMCGHVELDHDAIARRYCAATTSGDLTRGCICREASNRPPHR